MVTSRELWPARRRQRPTASIDSCELRAAAGGGFHVVIQGRHLVAGAMPPQVRIGDRSVRRVENNDGTVLWGLVAQGAPGERVTVDLGPGGEVTSTVGRVL